MYLYLVTHAVVSPDMANLVLRCSLVDQLKGKVEQRGGKIDSTEMSLCTDTAGGKDTCRLRVQKSS